MENQKSTVLFEDRSQEIMAQRDIAAIARATQEVQAALVIAQRFPRDEIRVKARIIEACQRKDLAEISEYEYSRGGTRITGPTIDLLRAIANRWGNIRFGWSEVERRDGQSSVRCFAWDCQTNGQSERTFTVRHWRDTQSGGYAIEDERDIYELCANMASRRVRACLEEVIDADVVNAAIDQCRRTLKDGEKLPIKDRASAVLIAFSEFGVTQEMVETRIGNKMDAVSENQLASLRRVYKALKDGVGKREDYFKSPPVAPEFKAETIGTNPPGVFHVEQSDQKAEAAAGLAPVQAESKQAEAPPVQPPPPATGGPLRLLRDMARVAKVKEAELLGFLNETGTTDGSESTLEEVQLSRPNVIGLTIKNFSDIAAKIIAGRKK